MRSSISYNPNDPNIYGATSHYPKADYCPVSISKSALMSRRARKAPAGNRNPGRWAHSNALENFLNFRIPRPGSLRQVRRPLDLRAVADLTVARPHFTPETSFIPRGWRMPSARRYRRRRTLRLRSTSVGEAVSS